MAMFNEDGERLDGYQVYGYGVAPDGNSLLSEQFDLGIQDDRPTAEAVARHAVTEKGLRSGQVMRVADGRIVAYWDRQELG